MKEGRDKRQLWKEGNKRKRETILMRTTTKGNKKKGRKEDLDKITRKLKKTMRGRKRRNKRKQKQI